MSINKKLWCRGLSILSTLFLLAHVTPVTAGGGSVEPPDLKNLPFLRPGLPPGTLALALPSQLHLTQPQVGESEVARKTADFKTKLPTDRHKAPKGLFAYLLAHNYIAPVYLGPAGPTAPQGTPAILGYLTDRTHSTVAQVQLIKDVWSERALSELKLDENGRPVNFVVVMVTEDHSAASYDDFARFMVENKHCYLKVFERGPKGQTIIRPIDFDEITDDVLGATDNVYRGLIGDAQSEGLIAKVPGNFSQFSMAENLVPVLKWDDIVDHPKRSRKEAGKFFHDQPQALVSCPAALNTASK